MTAHQEEILAESVGVPYQIWDAAKATALRLSPPPPPGESAGTPWDIAVRELARGAGEPSWALDRGMREVARLLGDGTLRVNAEG